MKSTKVFTSGIIIILFISYNYLWKNPQIQSKDKCISAYSSFNIPKTYDIYNSKNNSDILELRKYGSKAGTNTEISEVYNVQRLDQFIANFKLHKKDRIRITRFIVDNNKPVLSSASEIQYDGSNIFYNEYDCKSKNSECICSVRIKFKDINKVSEKGTTGYFLQTEANNKAPFKLIVFNDCDKK